MTLFVYSNITKVITQLENWKLKLYQPAEMRTGPLSGHWAGKISLWLCRDTFPDVRVRVMSVNVSEFQSISAKSSIWVSCAVSCQSDYNLLIASSSFSSPGVNRTRVGRETDKDQVTKCRWMEGLESGLFRVELNDLFPKLMMFPGLVLCSICGRVFGRYFLSTVATEMTEIWRRVSTYNSSMS